MNFKEAMEIAVAGGAVSREGGKGDIITAHPENPKQDPPRLVRVYPKGHPKYPQGTVRLYDLHDLNEQDMDATDWKEVTPNVKEN